MKRKILEILKEKDDYVSGQDIAKDLDVSRTAVWKNIKKLKESGYQIESVRNRGYKLIEGKDTLSKEEIEILLKDNRFGDRVYYFDTIDSTNEFTKHLPEEEKSDGLIIISDEQTLGKGRLGRNWVSSKNEGLWMSILLVPDIQPYEATKITQIAAAAITKTLLKITDLDVKIKWPNDIVINGKKVCGILTEMNAEMNKINYVVLGMGLNINQEIFHEEIKDKATSLYLESNENYSRKKLIKEFIDQFELHYFDFIDNGDLNRTLNVCRDNSAVIGNKVKLIKNDDISEVFVKYINDDGHLVVENDKGEIEEIFYGEISIRGIDNKYI